MLVKTNALVEIAASPEVVFDFVTSLWVVAGSGFYAKSDAAVFR